MTGVNHPPHRIDYPEPLRLYVPDQSIADLPEAQAIASQRSTFRLLRVGRTTVGGLHVVDHDLMTGFRSVQPKSIAEHQERVVRRAPHSETAVQPLGELWAGIQELRLGGFVTTTEAADDNELLSIRIDDLLRGLSITEEPIHNYEGLMLAGASRSSKAIIHEFMDTFANRFDSALAEELVAGIGACLVDPTRWNKSTSATFYQKVTRTRRTVARDSSGNALRHGPPKGSQQKARPIKPKATTPTADNSKSSSSKQEVASNSVVEVMYAPTPRVDALMRQLDPVDARGKNAAFAPRFNRVKENSAAEQPKKPAVREVNNAVLTHDAIVAYFSLYKDQVPSLYDGLENTNNNAGIVVIARGIRKMVEPGAASEGQSETTAQQTVKAFVFLRELVVGRLLDQGLVVPEFNEQIGDIVLSCLHMALGPSARAA